MSGADLRRVQVVDSHTGGEPTRVVISGGPDLGGGSLAERVRRFRESHDDFRSAVVQEPRGSDVLVGALLTEPDDAGCAAGVIFFNNVGYLGMCGHGMIGTVVTLAHLGRLGPGEHRLDTPVGPVAAVLHGHHEVSVRNVPCRRYAKDVSVQVEGHGTVTGDVAWGGNWFFLVHGNRTDLRIENADELVDFTWRIRQALGRNGITGEAGAEIDHVELYGPPVNPAADSRNFVLCPGKAYDRSPCGTGTSAKIACLIADGKLGEGEVWRQESITGSLFEGSAQIVNGEIVPTIRGSAFVTSEAELILDPADPFRSGIC